MAMHNLLAAVAAFGVAGSALAQDPTPTSPDRTPASQPDQTTPAQPTGTQPTQTTPAAPMTTAQPAVTTPGVVQGGYAAPMTYTYPQGQFIQSGYTTPMTYGYPQGQVMPSGYASPMTYTQPGTMNYGTSGVIYPGTGYTTAGSSPTFSTYPAYGYSTVGTGYPAMTTASSGGFVSNVVAVPNRVARRLFRR